MITKDNLMVVYKRQIDNELRNFWISFSNGVRLRMYLSDRTYLDVRNEYLVYSFIKLEDILEYSKKNQIDIVHAAKLFAIHEIMKIALGHLDKNKYVDCTNKNLLKIAQELEINSSIGMKHPMLEAKDFKLPDHLNAELYYKFLIAKFGSKGCGESPYGMNIDDEETGNGEPGMEDSNMAHKDGDKNNNEDNTGNNKDGNENSNGKENNAENMNDNKDGAGNDGKDNTGNNDKDNINKNDRSNAGGNKDDYENKDDDNDENGDNKSNNSSSDFIPDEEKQGGSGRSTGNSEYPFQNEEEFQQLCKNIGVVTFNKDVSIPEVNMRMIQNLKQKVKPKKYDENIEGLKEVLNRLVENERKFEIIPTKKESTYFRINNRRPQGNLLLPGKKVVRSGAAKKFQTQLTVFIDISSSVLNIYNDMANIAHSLHHEGAHIVYYNSGLVCELPADQPFVFPRPYGSTNIKNTINQYREQYKKEIERAYIFTDGYDNFDLDLDNFSVYTIFSRGYKYLINLKIKVENGKKKI